MRQLKILIADDQALMRDGLQTILDLEPDMEVVATAENGSQALEMALEKKPHLALLDIQMPVLDGIACTRRLKEVLPDTIVLLLTTFMNDRYIIEGLNQGAYGYLLKDMESKQLIHSIREAASGKLIMPAAVAARLAANVSRLSTAPAFTATTAHPGLGLNPLSERERDVAKLMLQGLTNKQMAKAMYMNEGTIRNYVSSIYSKLGVNDRCKALLLLQELEQRDPNL
ncbi:response regulator [Paenibacillus sp. GCM10027628]|uniref:response regulator transcription factor n=1 Tax=Paenibacillus sp. GCM10027628 TaxID=3273413 RepID=UPI003628E9AD